MARHRRFHVAIALAAAAASLLAAGAARAATADQCLSQDELSVSARMASVMSIGAALQRCGGCLGERYATAVHHYENEGLLKDFWKAQEKIKGQEKIDYVDDLVRQAARNRTASLSATCDACSAMVETLDGLQSDEARSRFYETSKDELAKVRTFRVCP